MANSTWAEREMPILDAVQRAFEEDADVNAAARAAVSNLSERLYQETVAALIEAGHLAGDSRRGADGEIHLLYIDRLRPRGLEAVGRWREERQQPTPDAEPTGDPRRVFLVQGRNQAAANAVTQLLESVGLLVVGWEEAVAAAGGGSPYILDIVRAGMSMARAIVVLLTPDDLACLDPRLQGEEEHGSDVPLAGRARQNVILEAGMALAFDDDHTILVEVGKVDGLSDLGGKHAVRLDASVERRDALLLRLETMGCDVRRVATRWASAGDFEAAVLPPAAFSLVEGAAPAPTDATPVILRGTALDNFHPNAAAAPSGRTFDLVVRCGVLLPHAISGPATSDAILSRLRGEERDDLLARQLDRSEISAWVSAQSESFHVAGDVRWHPNGYNALDVSELTVEPIDDTGILGPLALGCMVATGLVQDGHGVVKPGLRLGLDLLIRVLEYDQHRRPSPIRHTTTPPPAPAALSLDELLAAVVVTMSAVDVAAEVFAGLVDAPAPNDAVMACWLYTRGDGIDRLVDLTSLRQIPNSVTAADGRVRQVLNRSSASASLAPRELRVELATQLIGDILERAGRRGYGRPPA